VIERSGKKKWVHFRWAAPKFLRPSFHEWAGRSITQSQWARAYYEQQRQRGKGHHAVVRALAFKWIRIAYRCWKNSVAYDESKYLANLVRRASLLSASMVASNLAKTLWNLCGDSEENSCGSTTNCWQSYSDVRLSRRRPRFESRRSRHSSNRRPHLFVKTSETKLLRVFFDPPHT